MCNSELSFQIDTVFLNRFHYPPFIIITTQYIYIFFFVTSICYKRDTNLGNVLHNTILCVERKVTRPIPYIFTLIFY